MTEELERRAFRKATLRIIPFLFFLYISAYLDRINLGFAAVNFKKDLGFSEGVYGIGAGIFFLGYFLFEIPSNLMMEKTGARLWIARIMITWAIISSSMLCMAYVAPGKRVFAFYGLRFLLGVAEAGFFPGMILYLTKWFPAEARARAVSRFMIAIPISSLIGGPLSSWIMIHLPLLAKHSLSAYPALVAFKGWQWLFLLEGVPSFVMAFVVLFYLTDRPEQAQWLEETERAALILRLEAENEQKAKRHHFTLLQAFSHPRVLLITAIYLFINIGGYGLDFFLPSIIKAFPHQTVTTANLLTAIPALIAVIGMVTIGAHSDRTQERSLHIAIPCALGSIAMAIGAFAVPNSSDKAALSAHAGSLVLLLVSLSLGYFALRSALGPFWALPSAFLSGTAAAGGIAFINSVGNLGGFVGPYTIGKLSDLTHSFRPGLFIVALAILLIGVLALFTRKEPPANTPDEAGARP